MSHSSPRLIDTCGWNALLGRRSPKPKAEGAIRAKYAVVGAGFTGLAAARRLAELEPASEIAVVESSVLGEGPSSRSSGFAAPFNPPRIVAPADAERLTAINKFTREGMDWLRSLIAAHGIGCDLVQCGWIKAAATERGERVIAELSRSRQPPRGEFLTADQMQTLVGSTFYRGGLYFVDAYLLQPAALIRGLGETLPGNVRLYERTAVTAIEDCGCWLLRTSDASITADCVILANNALVKALGYLRDRLITIYTYAAMTEPISPGDDRDIGAAAWGVLPTHRLGTTSRRVGENRLLVRSLYSYERPMPALRAHEMLDARFRRRYPSLSDIKMEFVWGGTTALTMNGSPVWGSLGRGLYVSAGCNGAGIAKGTALGKKLAEAIAFQRRDAELEAAFGQASWIAPEPLRSLGFRLVSAWEQRRAGLES